MTEIERLTQEIFSQYEEEEVLWSLEDWEVGPQEPSEPFVPVPQETPW